jgi:general secretion pathway protein D
MKHALWMGILAGLTASEIRAQAQPPQARPEDKKVTATDLRDVDLHNLTIAVQKITKKTFLWAEDAQLGLRNKRVHFVSDRPVIDDPETFFKVFQSILNTWDLTLIPGGKPGEEVYKIVLANTSPKKAVPFRRDDTEPEERVVTQVFTLQYARPRDVHPALLGMSTLQNGVVVIDDAGLIIATDYEPNIKRFAEIIRAVDVKKPDVEMKLVTLKNAIATDVEKMLGDLAKVLLSRPVAGGRTVAPVAGMPGAAGQEPVMVVADRRTNSVILMAEPHRLPQLEDVVKRLDSESPFETSGIYVTHLRHTNAADVAQKLNAMYRGGVSSPYGSSTAPGGTILPGQPVAPQQSPQTTQRSYGYGTDYGYGQRTGTEPTIVPDERSNSLLIVTDRNTYKALEEIIRKLDQRQPQVLIKATVVEIRANDKFDLGAELNRLEDPTNRTTAGFRINNGYSTITPNPTDNTFSILPVDTPGATLLMFRNRIGNIGAILKALEDKARVSILDEPEAATNNNGLAEIKVSNQVPILQATVTGTGIVQTTFTRFETAETTLRISPHISEGGYLRLETTVKIEKFTRESADPTIPPPKTSREITTKEIMVPNGGTMVIGGIRTQDKSESESGVPFLKDIPLLGLAFKRTTETEENRTLYIFLTPYILYDHSFGDYRDLTRDRKLEVESLRGPDGALRRLNVDLKAERLPESTFRFMTPPPPPKN